MVKILAKISFTAIMSVCLAFGTSSSTTEDDFGSSQLKLIRGLVANTVNLNFCNYTFSSDQSGIFGKYDLNLSEARACVAKYREATISDSNVVIETMVARSRAHFVLSADVDEIVETIRQLTIPADILSLLKKHGCVSCMSKFIRPIVSEKLSVALSIVRSTPVSIDEAVGLIESLKIKKQGFPEYDEVGSLFLLFLPVEITTLDSFLSVFSKRRAQELEEKRKIYTCGLAGALLSQAHRWDLAMSKEKRYTAGYAGTELMRAAEIAKKYIEIVAHDVGMSSRASKPVDKEKEE